MPSQKCSSKLEGEIMASLDIKTKFSQADLHIKGNTKNSSSGRSKVNLDKTSEALEEKIGVKGKIYG